ncbi:MAG: hypothetical protein Q4A42_03025 [Tissierellia bacterium]|nr:hypothetical protein [Tissierellia bacterium]
MDKVIDLNNFLNRRLEIKVGDKTLKVRDINVLQFEKMIKIEESGTLDDQCKFLAEVLSANDEKIKITVDEVKNLTRATVVYLWQLIATRSIDIATDPN